jgi:alanine racemase
VRCATDAIPGKLDAAGRSDARVSAAYRPVWAEVDLAAVRANVHALRECAAPAQVLAVVKADGYGHGAVPIARAALEAGAVGLGVALVEEGIELRDAGIDAPILVLSEPIPEAAAGVVHYGLTPVVYTLAGIDALAKAVADRGAHDRLGVHLKVDTGMHRVGCRTDDAVDLGVQVTDRPELELAGVCTHLAVADEPGNPYTAAQLARFDAVLGAFRARGLPTGTVHASNTAGAIDCPAARFDMVRVGIGCYGIAPADELEGRVALQPALSVKARVSHVKQVPAGERISYGLRYETARATRIATVPIGYADGVPRELPQRGGNAIVRGRKCPMAGTVTMDQLMLDVGDLEVEVGDEVVLIGRQGDEEITAVAWARAMGTIAYTVVCGIGPRVPRTYVG